MRTPDDFIQLLKFLTKIFDETDIMMDDFIANSKKYEKQLKAYDLDLTDPKLGRSHDRDVHAKADCHYC